MRMTTRTRPLGVTIIAIIVAICGHIRHNRRHNIIDSHHRHLPPDPGHSRTDPGMGTVECQDLGILGNRHPRGPQHHQRHF